MAGGERLVVEAARLANPEENNGSMGLATTVSAEACLDAAVLRAYQEHHTTVEPGFRWLKNPAASSPVWLEQPERIAALAMLTVVGLLVYSRIQRQVRLSLLPHAQQVPGNQGTTATPNRVHTWGRQRHVLVACGSNTRRGARQEAHGRGGARLGRDRRGGSTDALHAEAWLTALQHLPMAEATTCCAVQGCRSGTIHLWRPGRASAGLCSSVMAAGPSTVDRCLFITNQETASCRV